MGVYGFRVFGVEGFLEGGSGVSSLAVGSSSWVLQVRGRRVMRPEIATCPNPEV